MSKIRSKLHFERMPPFRFKSGSFTQISHILYKSSTNRFKPVRFTLNKLRSLWISCIFKSHLCSQKLSRLKTARFNRKLSALRKTPLLIQNPVNLSQNTHEISELLLVGFLLTKQAFNLNQFNTRVKRFRIRIPQRSSS